MTQLFLTNIPYDCEDGELRGWLERQGFCVDSLRIVRDLVAGVSPAFGYVSVRVPDERVDAIRMLDGQHLDRKSTRLNSSHLVISYAVFCLKKKTLPCSGHPVSICRRHLAACRMRCKPRRLCTDRFSAEVYSFIIEYLLIRHDSIEHPNDR